MTAGRGIAHSEYSTPATTVLHGVQLWVALPGADRSPLPLSRIADGHRVDGAKVLVFLGSLVGQTSPVPMFRRWSARR